MVSVIIAAYNAQDTLEDAAKSVLEQTHTDLELLIVDDGSTDRTAETAARIQARDTRVRVIHQENQGVSSARNAGLREAHGEFIGFLDADDAYFPDKLEKQVAGLRAHPEAGGAYSDLVVTDSALKPIRPPRYGPAPFDMVEVLSFLCWIAVGTVLLRQTALKDTLWFDTSLTRGEDQDFFYRCAKRFRFVYVPGSVVRYRQWDGQTTAGKTHRATLDRQRFVDKHFAGDAHGSRNALAAEHLSTARAAFAQRRPLAVLVGLGKFVLAARSPARAWKATRLLILHR